MTWKTHSSKYLLETKWLKIRQDKVELPNGLVMDDYMIVERNNVAMIVAVDAQNHVLLKKEYRYPVNRELVEIPGGTFEGNEDNPLEVAKRELWEETGYASDDWELLFCNYDYPTKDIENVYIYLARNIKKVSGQHLDEAEDITFELVPMEKAVEMCMDNTICVNNSIAGILKAARMLGV